ncbi:MAG: hypothetical protein DDT24_00607 [Chloroflexi bacterium]|nr:hypothetical protein [Chloroflexota bacterium]MBT9163687.1 hypothetical protein [Chloroflexota bacterium]
MAECAVGHCGGGNNELAIFGDELAVIEDHIRLKTSEIVEHHQVCPIARSYCPQSAQPEVFRSIDGGHLNGPDGVESPVYRLSHHGVDVAIAQEIGATAVVYHKEASLEGPVGNQREQGIEILLGGAFTNHEMHSPIQLLPGLIDGGALVVGVDPRAEVGIQSASGETGGMAIDNPAPEKPELGPDTRIAADHAGEIHHLAKPDHVLEIHDFLQFFSVEPGTGGLQMSGRHTGGGHPEYVHRKRLGAF